MKVRALHGSVLETALDNVARLRISVFREWPYLYDGTMSYELDYLNHFLDNPQAVIVGAFDNTRLVGAATGTPVAGHADEFGAALTKIGMDLSEVFYCGESVLLSEYRGQGIGHRFFDLREAHARELGCKYSTFPAVVRSDDHPARPKDPRSLEPFWRGRGYAPLPGAEAQFSWTDVGDPHPTSKAMQFWIKTL